ncbi:MAG: DUF4368 domain-containing protein [Oscillospiraceae bacterium]
MKIYEDNANGKLSDERFSMMSGNYEAEQKKLRMDAVELQKNIEEQERQNARLEKSIQKAKHYQDLNSLTPDALRDMVSAIYVGAPDKSSGKRQQKIEIYYDGAGFIPLNLLMQRNGVTEVTLYSPRKSGLLIFSCFTGTALSREFFICTSIT